MAYFGDLNTERPFPKVDTTLIAFVGALIIGCLALAWMLIAGSFSKAGSATVDQVKEKIVEVPVQPPMREVLVPVRDIRAGQRLTPELFRKEKRAVTGMEDKLVSEYSALNNAYATSAIFSDTLVFKEHLSTSASSTNVITAKIPEGFRAVAITVDAESAVEGWARPGARVDVVWSTTHRNSQVVTTIVENAEVLSAERVTKNENGERQEAPLDKPIPSHITLLVTTADAHKIQLAKASGSLSLNLRGDSDTAPAGSQNLTVERLLRNANQPFEDESDGKVSFGGKSYVIVGKKLVSEAERESQR